LIFWDCYLNIYFLGQGIGVRRSRWITGEVVPIFFPLSW